MNDLAIRPGAETPGDGLCTKCADRECGPAGDVCVAVSSRTREAAAADGTRGPPRPRGSWTLAIALAVSSCAHHSAPQAIALRNPTQCPQRGRPVASCPDQAALFSLNHHRGMAGLRHAVRYRHLEGSTVATVGVSAHVLRRDGVIELIAEAAEQGTVWVEGASWELFEPALDDESLRRLATIKGLEGVVCGTVGISSAALTEFFRAQPTLRVVRVSGSAVDDEVAEVLGSLWELRMLSVRGGRVTDEGLAKIAGLPHLETLDLSGTAITSQGLALLGGTTTLRELGLDGPRHPGGPTPPREEFSLAGMAPLAALPRFTTLRARHRNISGLSSLAQLPHLSTLVVENSRGLSNLEPLAGLGELRTLDLADTDASDLRPLRGLAQLEELDLSSTHPLHLEDLAGLTRLRRLHLNNVYLSWSSLAPLAALPQIEAISVRNSGIDCTGNGVLLCGFSHRW